VSRPQADVVVAGHTCLDLIPTFPSGAPGLQGLLAPGKLIDVGRLVAATGGAVPNTGVALHRLGVRARLVGKLGDDVIARALCFHGGIDNQRVLPFGTPEEVRQEVRRAIDALAGDGTGYILAPCHNLQAVTPVESIVAMYDEAWRYGKLGT